MWLSLGRQCVAVRTRLLFRCVTTASCALTWRCFPTCFVWLYSMLVFTVFVIAEPNACGSFYFICNSRLRLCLISEMFANCKYHNELCCVHHLLYCTVYSHFFIPVFPRYSQKSFIPCCSLRGLLKLEFFQSRFFSFLDALYSMA